MRKVEIHPAHMWTCDECGRDNFCYTVVCELSEEEKAELAEEGFPTETGEWTMAPTEVTCKFCNTEFKTVLAGIPDDSED